MKAYVVSPLKVGDRLINKGEIIQVTPSEAKKLSNLITPVAEGEKLNRKCVNCGADSWQRAKTTGNTLITCLNCGHCELFIDRRRMGGCMKSVTSNFKPLQSLRRKNA